jgi:hypothetical protein
VFAKIGEQRLDVGQNVLGQRRVSARSPQLNDNLALALDVSLASLNVQTPESKQAFAPMTHPTSPLQQEATPRRCGEALTEINGRPVGSTESGVEDKRSARLAYANVSGARHMARYGEGMGVARSSERSLTSC